MRKYKKLIILLSFVLALVAVRLYLPVIVLRYINKELNRDPEYKGSVEAVTLHLWRGAYALHNLAIERVEGQKQFPFIAADRIDIGLSWSDLFKKSLVAKIMIDKPVINLVNEKTAAADATNKDKPKKEVAIGADSKAEKKEETQTWHEVFKNLVPLDISVLDIDDGSIHFRDITSKPKLDVFIDKIEAVGENLTNSSKLSQSLFGKIDVRARAMKSGKLNVVVLMNPTIDPLEAKISIKLVNLALTNLNDLFTAYANFDVKKGEFELFSEIAIAKHNIKGYAKPLIHDLQVSDFKEDAKKDVIHALWEKVVGAIGFLLKNHAKDQQGAEVHFEGRTDQPNVKTWDAIVSIFQNIFIHALPKGLDHTIQLKDVSK